MTSPATCKQRLEQYLRSQGVAYEFQHHSLAYTARGVAASEHLLAKESGGQSRNVHASARPAAIITPDILDG